MHSTASSGSPTQYTLVDLHRNTVYQLKAGRNIIASSAQVLSTFLVEDTHIQIIPCKDQYIAEVNIDDSSGIVTILAGSTKSTVVSLGGAITICSGQVLRITSSLQLKFVIRIPLRQLPSNPVKKIPFSSTTTTTTTTKKMETSSSMQAISLGSLESSRGSLTASISSPSLTTSYQMDDALQNTLKRLSRDIHFRKTGQRDSKQPLPPMYERVGNSIAYQLLLQSHPNISQTLITSMYPALKELETSTKWLFEDYLESFDSSLKKKATPQCLHPADVPTVKFLTDLCVEVCSLPVDDKQHFIVPDPSLWMHLLSIFSTSPQNQQVLVDYKSPSKVVGCMNLTSMADNKELQSYGWEVLSQITSVPTPIDKKPSVHIQAVTLLISHMKRQLDQYTHCGKLTSAILKFLCVLTTTVRSCATATSSDPPTYSQSYARDIFQLLDESGIREMILELPVYIQDDEKVDVLLQTIMIALAPLPVPTPRKPPPKPKRNRCRTQLFMDPPSLEGAKDARPTGATSPTPRKLPMLPPKKLLYSKSSENVLEEEKPVVVQYDAELSLPVHLIHKPQRLSPSDQSKIKRPQRILKVEPTPPPEQLPHYNRVSFKRESRGSYLKAIRNSQHIHKQQQDEPTSSSSDLQAGGIETDHGQILQTLRERKELLCGISELWRAEKSLQAASNCIVTCFFNGHADIPLFIDCLECFCSKPSYWTLGVCIVLLPYIRQVIMTQQEIRYFHPLHTTLSLILKRFSTVLLAVKQKKTSKADTEQKQACYHELHLLATTVSKIKSSPLTETALAEEMNKLFIILKSFIDPLY